MKDLKRKLAVLLTLCLVLTGTIPAYAEEICQEICRSKRNRIGIYKSRRFVYNHYVLRRDRIYRLSKEKVRAHIITATRKAGYKSTGDLL